jgi:hypothetical protein
MYQLIQAINNEKQGVDDCDDLDMNLSPKVFNLIRDALTIDKHVELFRNQDHFRISGSRAGLAFDMSGYDSKNAGDCHKYNQYILSLFSDLDLARNMKLMYLDFYKGIGTFYYIYWNDDELKEEVLSGYTTTEIIYEIIKICIINNPTTRRRESKSLYASNN